MSDLENECRINAMSLTLYWCSPRVAIRERLYMMFSNSGFVEVVSFRCDSLVTIKDRVRPSTFVKSRLILLQKTLAVRDVWKRCGLSITVDCRSWRFWQDSIWPTTLLSKSTRGVLLMFRRTIALSCQSKLLGMARCQRTIDCGLRLWLWTYRFCFRKNGFSRTARNIIDVYVLMS